MPKAAFTHKKFYSKYRKSSAGFRDLDKMTGSLYEIHVAVKDLLPWTGNNIAWLVSAPYNYRELPGLWFLSGLVKL